ncbi:werner helicase-interacting protein 1 family member [Holotrichia oblita]|nr:werner helicase-interacting protein 1 family member [Holotrichia oblita]
MDNLFTNMHNDRKPLAEKMRPKSLGDFVGQQHILGQGKLLRRLIEAKRVPSVIFYGPPGTGKTTLASIIAESAGARFVKMNAVSSGVAEVKVVIEEAKRILKSLQRAIVAENGLKHFNIKIDGDALNYFATACSGDVRSALNGLEVGALTTNINANGETVITKEIAVECLQKKALSLDEDLFYHILSAFCKSLRGSDATAALYYANRLIESGRKARC